MHTRFAGIFLGEDDDEENPALHSQGETTGRTEEGVVLQRYGLRVSLAVVALVTFFFIGCILPEPWRQAVSTVGAEFKVGLEAWKIRRTTKVPASKMDNVGVGRPNIFRAAAVAIEKQVAQEREPAEFSVQLFKSHFEWEIVFPGDVRVRSSKNMSKDSNIIGAKLPGSVLFGYEEDGWLKLFNDSGFVALVVDDQVLVQERSVSYAKLAKHTCSDVGLHTIFDLLACEAAAASLGLNASAIIHQSYEDQFDSGMQPGGCRLEDGKQVVLRASLSKPQSEQVEHICSTRGYAPLVATTDTTTTLTDTTLTDTTLTDAWVLPARCNQCTPHGRSKPTVVIPVFERDLCKLKVTAKSIVVHDKHSILGDVILCWVSRHPASEYARELEEIKDVLSPSHNVSVEQLVVGANGWVAQQVAKLKIASKITSEWYVVLDAKNNIIADIEPTTFFTECNQGKIFGRYAIDEMPAIHATWYRNAASVLGVPPTFEGKWPASITPVVMHRQKVLDLLDAIGEPREFGPCVGGLCGALARQATEFTLYYAFVQANESAMSCLHATEEHAWDPEIAASVWRGYGGGDATYAARLNMDLVHRISVQNESGGRPLIFGAQTGAFDMITGQDHVTVLRDLWTIYKDAGIYDFENWDELAGCIS